MEKWIHIVVFGELCQERIHWGELEQKLRIKVILAPSLRKLQQIAREREVEGALVEMPHVGLVKKVIGKARVVACHAMSAPPEPEELESIGAFHAVALPLNFDEVLHSFGFLWQAAVANPKFAKVIAIDAAQNPKTVVRLEGDRALLGASTRAAANGANPVSTI